MPNIKVVPIVKTCPQCGQSFEVGGRGRPRVSQVYDSLRCKALARITQPTVNILSAQDISYIAGLFDGEGSIILWDRGYGGRKQLRCCISNTYEPIMNWLQRVAGTGSVVRHIHPKEKGYKDSLTWQVYGQNAVSILKQMLPMLIIKKDKALKAIESQKLFTERLIDA